MKRIYPLGLIIILLAQLTFSPLLGQDTKCHAYISAGCIQQEIVFCKSNEGGPYNYRDIAVLREIIKMNDLEITPLELGEQVWMNGRLTWLIIGTDGMKIKRLPESLGQLTELESLFLSENKLQALPNSIGKLKKLQNLYVDSNELKFLPESIGDLTQLENLYLNDNKLLEVPATIANCNYLHNLYLNDNYIDGVPKEVSDMPSLRNFFYQPAKQMP